MERSRWSGKCSNCNGKGPVCSNSSNRVRRQRKWIKTNLSTLIFHQNRTTISTGWHLLPATGCSSIQHCIGSVWSRCRWSLRCIWHISAKKGSYHELSFSLLKQCVRTECTKRNTLLLAGQTSTSWTVFNGSVSLPQLLAHKEPNS